MTVAPFRVGASARVLLADLGVAPADVLRSAGLLADLFTRGEILLTPRQYYALFEALDALSGNQDVSLQIARALTLEAFDPPIFAAMCSPNLQIAAERIAVHKRLLGPLRLDVAGDADGLDLTIRWPAGDPPPAALAHTEALFWVALARLGTRTRVVPQKITVPAPPGDVTAWEAWAGARAEVGDATTVGFSRLDAARPFLTANAGMWEFFAPELRRRLADLGDAATTAGKVRAALLELLPSGCGTTVGVARHLGISTRTLQRRLTDEDVTFQALLAEVRERLARHYLTDSSLPVAEIAFLLGYDDPNSFYRAFNQWTGTTPLQHRDAASA